jgi:hypothetical protein
MVILVRFEHRQHVLLTRHPQLSAISLDLLAVALVLFIGVTAHNRPSDVVFGIIGLNLILVGVLFGMCVRALVSINQQ